MKEVEDRLTELMKMVEQNMPHGYVRQRPRVTYYDNKLYAGRADYRKHEIQINRVMLVENLEDMLYETVAHELAHLITFTLYGRKAAPHGREWQHIMRSWFNVEPSRCHNYDTTNVKAKRQDRWEAKCDCQTHRITTVLRNRIMMGQGRRCITCHSLLHLTGAKA